MNLGGKLIVAGVVVIPLAFSVVSAVTAKDDAAKWAGVVVGLVVAGALGLVTAGILLRLKN